MLALGGVTMIQQLMERLVLDVVLSVVGDEGERLSLESDFDVLDVDQLTITHIVLALESRLGLELPTSVEEARTVVELVAGAQKAVRENVVTKSLHPAMNKMSLHSMQCPASKRHPTRRITPPSHYRPRRQSFGSRATQPQTRSFIPRAYVPDYDS
jgi:acyl carrier protein